MSVDLGRGDGKSGQDAICRRLYLQCSIMWLPWYPGRSRTVTVIRYNSDFQQQAAHVLINIKLNLPSVQNTMAASLCVSFPPRLNVKQVPNAEATKCFNVVNVNKAQGAAAKVNTNWKLRYCF